MYLYLYILYSGGRKGDKGDSDVSFESESSSSEEEEEEGAKKKVGEGGGLFDYGTVS